MATESGFVRDTFEKVLRLKEILKFLNEDKSLREHLLLKGGTAINLTVFNLPRLSVDIDMDYTPNDTREGMLECRAKITDIIKEYMESEGYQLSEASRFSHSLDAFHYNYQNAGGNRDMIKIELNYSLRAHIFEPVYRSILPSAFDDGLKIRMVNPLEIFAAKGNALITRAAARDLYDWCNMLSEGLFEEQRDLFRKCFLFYMTISADSMMKDRYELISQDIVKVQGNGLFVSLVKGSSSKVKYRNSENGEVITLSYNPKSGQVPTVAQKPDNVLSLEKKTVNQVGKKVKYEYVFDAKYRVNPALEGSDYYNTISHTPGPETDDINTMHRYRDAIVYHNGADPYERTMFGAYVLFPYANKEEYRNHKFFESIEKVNIGGLPFLPSETSMVQDMLDALIADSPDSAFERATLPRGIEDKLAKIDWNQRDVLVGALRNRAQLDTCLKYKFYHIPASKIRDADLPIHYVAIYQSINIFGREAGIRYYGEVTKTSAVKRRDIREIPKNSDEAYYRFEIKEWKELNIPLVAKEVRDFPFFTNMFLLQHCPDVPDLHISSEEEYRLYIEVRRLANDASVNETDAEPGFKYDDKTIIMENGDIVVLKDGTKIEQISIETFMRKPRESMRVIAK